MHVYKSIEEKIAAAQSATPNEFQDHNYSADETPGHIQPKQLANIGERQARVVETKPSGGRHITQPQKADGQKQKPNVDREGSVLARRKESEQSWKSSRKSIAPNHRSK